MDTKTYDVVEYSIGSKEKQERIIFKSMSDMLDALKSIRDNKDIFVSLEEDGKNLVINVDGQSIGNRYYKGEIVFGSLEEK